MMRPGSATRRIPQRSIMRPRTGTATAEKIPPIESANEPLLRCHPISAIIGLRNTPKVNPRTGPLHTNKPVTAPTTTHQGFVNRGPNAFFSRSGSVLSAQCDLETALGARPGHHRLVPPFDVGVVGEIDLMALMPPRPPEDREIGNRNLAAGERDLAEPLVQHTVKTACLLGI